VRSFFKILIEQEGSSFWQLFLAAAFFFICFWQLLFSLSVFGSSFWQLLFSLSV
jgi:hypothetical protein